MDTSPPTASPTVDPADAKLMQRFEQLNQESIALTEEFQELLCLLEMKGITPDQLDLFDGFQPASTEEMLDRSRRSFRIEDSVGVDLIHSLLHETRSRINLLSVARCIFAALEMDMYVSGNLLDGDQCPLAVLLLNAEKSNPDIEVLSGTAKATLAVGSAAFDEHLPTFRCMKRVGKLMETQATLDQWHDGLLEPAFKQFFILDAHPALRHVNGAVNRSAKLLIVEKLAAVHTNDLPRAARALRMWYAFTAALLRFGELLVECTRSLALYSTANNSHAVEAVASAMQGQRIAVIGAHARCAYRQLRSICADLPLENNMAKLAHLCRLAFVNFRTAPKDARDAVRLLVGAIAATAAPFGWTVDVARAVHLLSENSDAIDENLEEACNDQEQHVEDMIQLEHAEQLVPLFDTHWAIQLSLFEACCAAASPSGVQTAAGYSGGAESEESQRALLERCENLRTARQLTQTVLASEAGVHGGSYSSWKGKKVQPNHRTWLQSSAFTDRIREWCIRQER